MVLVGDAEEFFGGRTRSIFISWRGTIRLIEKSVLQFNSIQFIPAFLVTIYYDRSNCAGINLISTEYSVSITPVFSSEP